MKTSLRINRIELRAAGSVPAPEKIAHQIDNRSRSGVQDGTFRRAADATLRNTGGEDLASRVRPGEALAMGKMLRGALIEYGSDFLGPIPNVVIFQFNPETLTRTSRFRPETPAQPHERQARRGSRRSRSLRSMLCSARPTL